MVFETKKGTKPFPSSLLYHCKYRVDKGNCKIVWDSLWAFFRELRSVV
jgi:hypothetical protein